MSKLKIKITGVSGYLGTLLSAELINRGHKVSGIKRQMLYGPAEHLAQEIKNTDVIINLAGAPILQIWTKKRKKVIFESRVLTTKNLISAINMLPEKEMPKKFVSASAIGIYKSGFHHDEESTNFNEGFDGHVIKSWEEATNELPNNIQKYILRIGLTIGRYSQIIKLLSLPFKLGLGATVGRGSQSFPFVHTDDVVRAFLWTLDIGNNQGIYNVVAPENINNRAFSTNLAQVLKRPMFLIIPKFIFNLVMRESATLITDSPAVEPRKLLESGFTFKYPTIRGALAEVFS